MCFSWNYLLTKLKFPSAVCVCAHVLAFFFFNMVFVTSSNFSFARGIFPSDVLMRTHSKILMVCFGSGYILMPLCRKMENKPRKEPLNVGGVCIPWHSENTRYEKGILWHWFGSLRQELQSFTITHASSSCGFLWVPASTHRQSSCVWGTSGSYIMLMCYCPVCFSSWMSLSCCSNPGLRPNLGFLPAGGGRPWPQTAAVPPQCLFVSPEVH